MVQNTLKASKDGFLQIRQALQEIQEIEKWPINSDEWIKYAAKLNDPLWKEGDNYPTGFSLVTWKKFVSGYRGKPVAINAKAFKIFCKVLGLKWEDIVEIEETNQKNLILNIEVKNSLSFPCHNLPSSSYVEFVVRHIQLTDLKEKLSIKNNNISQITITGIGGIGKTSLILEAANYCLTVSQERSDENYQYNAIVFSTFKQKEITSEKIITPSYKKELSCQQILKDIATTFEQKELLKLDFNSCIDAILDLLRKYKTLLIVDNLETVEDINDIIWFLRNLPKKVKVVITSRKKTDFGISININLDELSEASGLKLIKHIAELKNIKLDEKQEKDIYRVSCGIPLAIVLIIGQIANHHSFESVIKKISLAESHIVDYCLESFIEPLKGKSSYKLLTALALLSKITCDEIITEIAKITNNKEIDKGFTELKKLNLIQRSGEKYQILPIIRSYVLVQLKEDTNWEKELRNNWVNWYQEFVEQYGGKDEKEWNDYQELETEWENITDVISWCINEDRYNDVKYFWQQIKSYSYLRGYQSDRLTNWNNRLEWNDWTIKTAKMKHDYEIAIEVMFDKAWILTLIETPEKLNEAIELFSQVWLQKKHHHNPIFQIDLAIDICYVRIIQNKINKAQQWLNKAKQLLTKTQVTEASHPRRFMIWNFYQGWVLFEQKQYNEAKIVFEKSLKLAENNQWQRGISLCENWLCDVAIELEDFEFAEETLKKIFTIADNNNDRVTIAFCYQSLAFLEKARGYIQKSKDNANEAIEKFQKLGMNRQIEATRKEFLT